MADILRNEPHVRGMAKYARDTGDGLVTEDGCPVEVYARLRACGEPELIGSLLPPGGSVLDLGAGAGRLAHPLIEMGYAVTAVDQSAEMLAHIRGAEAVRSSIENLDLGSRTFDAVLLASYLLNTPDPYLRSRLLGACRRYSKKGGVLLAQVRSPGLLSDRCGFSREEDGVRDTVDGYSREGALVTMTVRTEMDGRRWVQTFTHEYLEEVALACVLQTARFAFRAWLDAQQEWFHATAQ